MDSFFDRLWHQRLGRPYQLHSRHHGQHGPVIILLHGIAASSDKWGELILLLETNYRCITIDLLGFGRSPKPQWVEYRMEDHLRSLHKTIAGLQLHEDYMLAGHSLGSLLATRYARDHRQHISRLLLLSPPVYPPLKEIKGRLARGRTVLFLRLYKFLRSHPKMTPANFKRLSLILPLPKSVIKQPATWTPFMRSLEHCIEQQTILQDIKDLPVPVDVFHGALDQVVVAENLAALGNLSGVTFHTVRAANHDINKYYARAVAKALVPNLKRTGHRPGSSRKPHTS